VAAAVCLSILVLLCAAPSAMAKDYYVALGASLAEGIGASSPAKDYVSLIYGHEAPRYPSLSLKSFACGGTTTLAFIHGPGCGPGTQLGKAEAFLTGHRGKIAFVTIDIGANEMIPCIDEGAVNSACAEGALGEDSVNLPIIIGGLQATSPGVRIFAMNYYDPYLSDGEKGEPGLALAGETLAVVDRLNSELEAIYAAYGVPVADTAGAFESHNFSLTGSFLGATLPQNIANICNWTHMCPERNVHTNDTGHALLAATFEPVIDASFEAPLGIGTTTLPPATVGQSYSAPLEASGGLPPLKWSHAGRLAPGLKLDAKAGMISGKPTKVGSYAFEVGVAGQTGHGAARKLTITVG